MTEIAIRGFRPNEEPTERHHDPQSWLPPRCTTMTRRPRIPERETYHIFSENVVLRSAREFEMTEGSIAILPDRMLNLRYFCVSGRHDATLQHVVIIWHMSQATKSRVAPKAKDASKHISEETAPLKADANNRPRCSNMRIQQTGERSA